MAKRKPTNDLPTATAADDHISRALYLLEYCRQRGFRVGPVVTVGDVTMQVEDIRQAKVEGQSFEAEPGLYEIAGAVDEPADGTAG